MDCVMDQWTWGGVTNRTGSGISNLSWTRGYRGGRWEGLKEEREVGGEREVGEEREVGGAEGEGRN